MFKLNLGGKINGISPTVTHATQQGNSLVAPFGEASQIPMDRTIMRSVFPTTSTFEGKSVMTNKWAQTPFRIAMNAGDLLSRQTQPGGSNQIKGSVGIGQFRYSLGASPSQGGSVTKGNGASGNQHYVYDSSVYTNYKRLNAKNKNYNDYSFGGSNNGAYTAILASRRR